MINHIIKSINKSARVENKYWGCVFGGDAVEVEVGELLYGLVRASKPKTLVETGTNKGYSTLHILEAIRRNGIGFLYTFDIEDLSKIIPREYNKYYQFIHGDSITKGKELCNRLEGNIDFLFLDSLHTTGHVINEIRAFWDKVKIGGIIVFHDTILDENENLAIECLKERYKVDLIRLYTSRGLDITIKKE